MFQISDLTDLRTLSETSELEFKLAQGKDGQGKLPDDFWPTYSSMANCRGGYVVLGIKEKKGEFSIAGIPDINTVKKQLFDLAGSKKKVNVNLLTNQFVQTVKLEGKDILVVEIPIARREQKPVYLNNQPMTESWCRMHDGDHRCSEEQVRRMMAEQVESSRDDKILSGFDIADIEMESLNAYKRLLSTAKPQHPWLELELFDFLKKIGGWRKDRQSGEEGMTFAGILMFGTWQAIQDAAPNYFIDYQERPEAKTEQRWIDRICPDGTWSGNVFDFYRRTYRKLTTEIKIPFNIKQGIRLDETLIHVALREALVNTLVHADFSGRASILVVKRPDMFGFRNPGLMRIPPEIAIKGGDSDCRNRRMHQMFLNIGAGERAGSGIPKIYSGWQSANWRTPKLYEKTEPTEQTVLELSTVSLIPTETSDLLQTLFGTAFNTLDDFERMIVTTAAIEGWVNHQRACQLTSKHPRDVTLTLPRLETKGFLVSSGERRDKSYSLPGMEPPSPEDVFPNALRVEASLTHSSDNLTYSGRSSTHSGDNLTHRDKNRDPSGRLVSPLLDKPFVDELDILTPAFKQQLEHIASLTREKKRLSTEEIRDVIKALCTEHFMAISVLSQLINRTAQNIRQSHLKMMVEENELRLAFPNKPNSPKQGYTIK
ncbi:AlbA family DNA-binding domain-containing protein [Yersinia enterocolitica]